MNHENSHLIQTRAVGQLANELAMPVTSLMRDYALPAMKAAALAEYRLIRDGISRFAMLSEPVGPRDVVGALDDLPPLATPQNFTFPTASFYPKTVMPALDAFGQVVRISDQHTSTLTVSGMAEMAGSVGRNLALGIEEMVTDYLIAQTYPAAQLEASALTATSLASAVAKAAVLRTASGGYGHPPAVLIVGHDLMPTIRNVWANGPGLAVVPLTSMPVGRWFVLPAPTSGIIRLDMPDALVIREHSDATAAAILDLHVLASANPLVQVTAAGAPRFVIRGGT